MNRVFKLTVVAALMAVVLLSSVTVQAANSKTYIYNEYAEEVSAPAGYVSDKVIFGEKIGVGSFKALADLFVDEQERIYVADAGNNRVLIFDKDFNLLREITKVVLNGEAQPLANPMGVYYRDGLVYICDTDNARAVAVDENNNVKRIFLIPETSLLAEDFDFKPSKITVNSAGTVFMAASGVYQGLLQYSDEDEFIGFFGANKVTVTPKVIVESIWKNIFSAEQRESMVRAIPTEYTNLYIDSEDMILTATAIEQTKQIKKLNSAGTNILVYPGSSGNLLQRGYNRSNFGDQKVNYVKGGMQVSSIIDVNVDEDGVIAVLDSQRGRVFMFDSEQNPLCIAGGSGNQAGLFKKVIALDKCGTSYLVADMDANSITVFAETEYMRLIRNALNEYSLGNYEESAKYWDKVSKLNSGLAVAYKGIGRAQLIGGEYKEAMKNLKMGDDRFYYSMAIQRYRREYVRENFLWLVPLGLAAIVGFVLGVKYLKRAIINSGKKRGG